MVRVLVVDDSPSAQALLVYILGSDPGIEVVGCASNGKEALQMAQEKRPDVITMDLQMPQMDGFEATRRIMQICPAPIVIVSGSNDATETSASFRAIEAGALIVVQRPPGIGNAAHARASGALIRTVKSMAEVKVVRRWRRAEVAGARRVPEISETRGAAMYSLVVIGASTGGPAILCDILTLLPKDFSLPIVIVQHMSAGFTAGFAQWLSTASGFATCIAAHGESLVAGRAYLAPDGRQLGIARDLRIILSEEQPRHGMCPSVSHLFQSIHEDMRPSTVAVLLTGMGKDGAQELRRLRDGGALTIVQDQASSAVYGMPGEAIRHGAATLVLEPAEIAKALHAASRQMPPFRPFGHQKAGDE
jgi:two-component system chemotaxis response regulator CheB